MWSWLMCVCFFVFFKQKTAYEMRISDWSSDVCSSDLLDSKGLSLGTLDLLRPAPSGDPFSLPDLDLRLRNVRMMLATPGGVVGLAAEGSGNLADGFNGRAALSAPRFQMADCRVAGNRGLFNLMAVDRVVVLDGRIRTRAASWGGGQAGLGAMLLSTSIP